MKLNRKGFTLVELLVTIVIVGLVVGLSVFGIVSLVKNSESKTITINESNIKEAARIYSSEASSDSWKSNDEYDAFCITIGELMNKGLLNKDDDIKGIYTRDSFAIVKRNKITLAVDNVEMVTEDISNEYNEICTGQVLKEEDYTKPVLGTSVSYTDRIEIPFTSGSADSGVKNYSCLYGEYSSNINKEGIVEGNTCVLDGLKNNKDYYVLIYMNTNRGSSVLAEGTRDYKTKDFKDTQFTTNSNYVNIQYDSSNIIGNKYYYFKSNVNTRSLSEVEKCTMKNNIFNCSDSSNDVEKDVWYRTINSNVKLDYSELNDKFNIVTKICDKSNNCHDNSKSFNVYNVKFYRNGASSIDGDTADYVEKNCIGDINGCNITSPSITAQTGYSVVGWNTSSTATSSSWDVGTSKDINSDMDYYAIINKNKVYIKYNVNGGSIVTASNDNGSWTADTSGIISQNGNPLFAYVEYNNIFGNGTGGLANYNNPNYINISKKTSSGTEYEVVSGSEWRCLSNNCTYPTYDQDSEEYKSSDFCDASNSDCTVELGVNWKGYIDINWIIDGTIKYSNPYPDDLKVGLKINDTDLGYVSDYYTQWAIGTSYEIYGLKLNTTNFQYSTNGILEIGGISINISVNTLNIGVNNSTYGGVSLNRVFVKPGTTYSVSGNKLSLVDGRTITASTKKVTGYTTSFTGWSTSSGTINSKTDVTANFNSRINKVYIKYSVNSGSLSSYSTGGNEGGYWGTQSETINNKTYNGVVWNSPNKDGTGKTTNLDVLDYGTAFTENGLLNYNNSNYMKITRSNYTASAGSAWKCLSGNCAKSTYSQTTNYAASDFCNASSSDCTVVIGVNWKKNSSSSGTTSGTISGTCVCEKSAAQSVEIDCAKNNLTSTSDCTNYCNGHYFNNSYISDTCKKS